MTEVFICLYDTYSADVRAVLHSFKIPNAEIDDLLHQAFYKAISQIQTWRAQSAFSAWLMQIARNEALMWYRYQKRETSLEDNIPDLTYTPDDQGDVEGCIQKGVKAFASKSPDKAHILFLILKHEWSISEVAHFLGKSQGATREYLSQCRKAVKPFIQHCLELIQ